MSESIPEKEIQAAAPEPTPYAKPYVTQIPAAKERRIPTLNLILFLLTLLTTTMAGAYMAGAELSLAEPLQSLARLALGLSFSVPLMAILLFHELGHYFTAKRHKVDATLPYFIPAPFPSTFIVGTFGAFIRMRSLPSSRRVMFDIGAAGPWAGMLLAVPAVFIGLAHSQVAPLTETPGGLELGNSLLFLGLARLVLGVDPNSVNINLNPVAFAGWIGLFVTALNLLPVGQLDGGHVIYALFGRRHRLISRSFVLFCVLMVVVQYLVGMSYWTGWLLWVAFLLFLGLGHPTTLDADTPLDRRRRVAAWLTIGLFLITFIPVPISFTPAPRPSEGKVYQVLRSGPPTLRRRLTQRAQTTWNFPAPRTASSGRAIPRGSREVRLMRL